MDLDSLINRLDQYGMFYSRNNPNQILTILAGISKFDHSQLDLSTKSGLRFIRVSNPTQNALLFAFRCARQIRKLDSIPAVLIAGDLYFSSLTCQIMKHLFPMWTLKTQISFHGFYFDIIGARKGIKPKLQLIYLRKLLGQVDSVRAVSPELQENLITAQGVDSTKVFVAPIPVIIDSQLPNTVRVIDVTFVGRFHVERGIDVLEEIIARSIGEKHKITFCLVGGGPLLESSKHRFSNHKSQVEFKGHLPHSSALGVMKNSKILLSTAKSEGYGLAVREALSAGCFLVAYANPITTKLQIDFPQLVFTFRNTEEALEIIDKLRSQIPNSTALNLFRRQQLEGNIESLQNLSESWKLLT